MDNSTFEELYAQAIGLQVMKCMFKEDVGRTLIQEAESAAMRALSEIQTILNDNTLDDPTCFHRIDGIVNVFYRHGLSTTRHDF